MKVLMIAPEPFFQPRGTPFSIRQRLEAMVKLGYTVDLLTYHLGQEVTLANVTIYRIRKVPFIRHIRIGPSYAKILLDFLLFERAFVMLCRNHYDCIHTHEEGAVIGAVLHRLFDLPHVYDMHSSLPQQLINYNFTHSPLLLTVAGWFEWWILKESDVIIAICPYLKELVERKRHGKRIVLVENFSLIGNNQEVSESELNAMREKWELDNSLVALYTGTFEFNQGLDLLLQSIKLIVEKERNIKFVLVGGEPEQVEKMKANAREMALSPYIIFAGKRPMKEMPFFTGIADMLLSPRKIGTNTPLKIYSYLASGKPIVATNLFTHTQVLNTDVAVLTDVSAEGFAAGILSLAHDEQLRIAMGQRARRLAEEKYSYENYLAKTREVYDWVNEKKSPLPWGIG